MYDRDAVVESVSGHFSRPFLFSEISFPVFRPGHPYPAETQTPTSLPCNKQTNYPNCAASETKDVTKPGQSRMHGDISKTRDDTNISNRPAGSKDSLEISNYNDIKPSKSLNEQTCYTRSHSPQINNLPTHSLTADHNKPAKDEQLKEEERFLLAKIHMMTKDTSPATCPRTMKLLIPAPGDIDSDATEPQRQPKTPVELTAHSHRSLIPCLEALQEIPLTEAEENV